MQRLQVQSLLEEITSDMLYGKAKKERERERDVCHGIQYILYVFD